MILSECIGLRAEIILVRIKNVSVPVPFSVKHPGLVFYCETFNSIILFINILLRKSVLTLIYKIGDTMRMLLKIIACSSYILFSHGTVEAQTYKNQSVGIQLNPYIDSDLTDGTFIKPVFALRYACNLTKNFSLGPEISGHYVTSLRDQTDFHISAINAGAFFRYSILHGSGIKPFIEISPYYTIHHFKSGDIVTTEGTGRDDRKEYFSGYFSPGISLYSKSQRLSLDLMYKFSDKEFVNGKKSVFSYRLNINF